MTGQSVSEGSWTAGIANIDIADFNQDGTSRFFDYVNVPVRSHNMARAFEEEYLGHEYMNSSRDGGAYSLSKVNKQSNLYRRERGLPERLNYGDGYIPIYFGNTNDYSNPRGLRNAIRQGNAPAMYLNYKKR
ncbi:hypothetical protein LJC45_05360 [Alistipes sp. OttesenSCG-928-B03]|nr:hypothetical protein [Alistipes sp. OttesenSCG-928-B03]